MSEQTHQVLEGMAAEYASAIECRRALEGALRRRLMAVADELAPALREAAGAERDCRDALISAVEDAPHLFGKPRSRTVHGIKYGWQAGKDRIEIPDEPRTIHLIRSRIDPAQQELLISRKESVYKPAVLDLTAKDLRLIGARQIPGDDSVICKPISDSVDALVNTLLADMERVTDAA